MTSLTNTVQTNSSSTNTQNLQYGYSYVSSLKSIAELRLYKPEFDGQVMIVSGGTYVGDSEGGIYVWSDNSIAVDNGVSVIASQYSCSTGRWLQITTTPVGSYTAPLTLLQNTGTDDALILQGKSSNNRASIAFNSDWEFGESVLNPGELGVYNKKLNTSPFRVTQDDQIATFWSNDKVNDQSAFDLAGAGLSINVFNGDKTPSASSSIGMRVVSNVYNTTTPPNAGNLSFPTYSEISPMYTFLQGFTKYNGETCTHTNEHYIGYDNHIVTPYTTDETKRPDVVVGMSYYASLYGSGSNKSDTNGSGSYMYSGVTTPLPNSTLEYYGIPDGTATVPFSAMFTACGFNGTPDITDGSQSGALNAADYGFLCGNGGTGLSGSFYLNKGARSKFNVGAQLGDWTTAGLVIGNPIGTQTPSGGRQYGIYNPFATNFGGLLPDQTGGVALYITPPTTTASRNVSISLGNSDASGTDGWSFGRDSAKTGANDLYFWSNTAQKNMLWMDDNKVGFYGTVPVEQQTMWQVGSGAVLADVITAVNRITNNLIASGIFGAAS